MKEPDFTLSTESNSNTIKLMGHIVRETANALWDQLQQLQTKRIRPYENIDLAQVTHCDSIGLITLLEFIHQAPHCSLSNIPPQFEKLFNTLSTQRQEPSPTLHHQASLSTLEKLGKKLCASICETKKSIHFIGETIVYLGQAICRPKQFNWRKLAYYLEDMGPKSAPLVILIGLLFGIILSFQSVVQLRAFGAEIYVANLVSVSLVRELGPLLVAIVMMGRSASAYAAEISAMNVNQEIDALDTMGLKPVPFLILPRLIAAAIIAPLLTLLMNFAGLFGCLLLMTTNGFTSKIVLQQMFAFLNPADLASGLAKATFFGITVVAIGCINGLKSDRDTMAVGRSTTNTVVMSIVAITVLDGLFTTVFFYLGL